MIRKTLTAALLFLGAALMFGTAAPAHAAETPKLAIDGYDPVGYFTEKQPIEGKPEFTHDWDGSRYQFHNAANRDRFAADPDRYAPNYAGNCAATLAMRGARIPANPKYWLIVDGKLYLFAGPQGPERFTKDPSLIEQADAKWKTAQKPKN